MRASRMRLKKVRGRWEITTYAAQTRGAQRRIRTISVDKQDIGRALEDPAVREALGIKDKEAA